MRIDPLAFMPKARTTKIIVKHVDNEVLVYDLACDKAHCLNESAAIIWQSCDGKTSVRQLAKSWGERTQQFVGETIILHALEQLDAADLLDQSVRMKQLAYGNSRTNRSSISRREVVKRVGLGVAIALPAVASITAPTPAQAGSCSHANASCSTGADCCSGTCVPNSPPSAGKHCLGG